MNVFGDALRWLNDPLNWQGERGILALTGQHLRIAILAVLLSALVAWPLALLMGHTGRGGGFTVVVSNVSRAVPTLALLTLLAVTPIGFGATATTLALAVFAIPPLLSNAYTGIREVDPDITEAARGMGLSGWQVLWKVEVPLAIPLIATGFRTATVQVIATAALAALVNGGGLGFIIEQGFGLQNYGQMIAGGFLIAALALSAEGLLALAQRLLMPKQARVSRQSPRARQPVGVAE